MTTKHTPGPWSIEDPLGEDIGLAIVQAGLKSYEWTFIAMVTRSEPGDSEEVGRVILPKEQMANARLIAAAPDMLAALQTIAASSQFLAIEGHAAVTAAIAKATGDTQ